MADGEVLDLVPFGDQFQCQCPHMGSACQRRAVGEDFLCAWCHDVGPQGHYTWCHTNDALGGSGFTAVQYDEVQYRVSKPFTVDAGELARKQPVMSYSEFIEHMQDGGSL